MGAPFFHARFGYQVAVKLYVHPLSFNIIFRVFFCHGFTRITTDIFKPRADCVWAAARGANNAGGGRRPGKSGTYLCVLLSI